TAEVEARLRREDFPSEFPELFDIVVVGLARLRVARGIEIPSEADPAQLPFDLPLSVDEKPGALRRQFKRSATPPPCGGKMEFLATALMHSGLQREALTSWALDAFDPDFADACIHMGAQLQVGVAVDRPFQLTIGS